MKKDFLVCVVHVLFWCAFGLTRVFTQHSSPPDRIGPKSTVPQVASYSRTLVVMHMMTFGLMYFGIYASLFSRRIPHLFMGQQFVATLVIALGAWLACWALLHFSSWRFRAKLDEGHQLVTSGPFKLVRHPIYAALNLLALGTAIWLPTTILLISLGLVVICSDLRARVEEKLLTQAFGSAYAQYCKRTSRFLPGVY